MRQTLISVTIGAFASAFVSLSAIAQSSAPDMTLTRLDCGTSAPPADAGRSGGVPTFNTSRAETLASLDRFKKIAANLKATVILQHDGRDIGKLPAFPAGAR